MIGSHPLLDFEALDLAGRGAGQILLPYFVAPDAFRGRDLGRQSFNIEANRFLRIHNLALPERIEIRDNHRVQTVAAFAGFAFESHDSDFLDER